MLPEPWIIDDDTETPRGRLPLRIPTNREEVATEIDVLEDRGVFIFDISPRNPHEIAI